ncbi:ribonuclease T [Afifella sp. JA880]|uniref:ribonuclease T2 family protein n=1 Tax=Afifella sp. JA880 TaxID=2975280 RepID=UPI0021BB6F89|nr:ribonuclease T [Afifella sp. JA880]MCT8266678.1 ribonuclease T [Afifella sp. JA880]
MRKIVVLFALLGLGLGMGRPALAQQVDLEGYFIALNACEATQKKTSDNPGGVRLEIMRAYKMLARNDTPGTHYRVEVPGAPESEARWVPMDCGVFAPETALVGESRPSQDGTETAKDTTAGNETAEQAQSGFAPDSLGYVLAASWQPGFCKTEAGHDKPECLLLRPGRFDALHFSLHGLWPDDLSDKAIYPCYCDPGPAVACTQNRPPAETIELDPDLLAALAVIMPGVQSGLHRHEWSKHGTCYEDDVTGDDWDSDPNEYYGESLLLMAQLNNSRVWELFARNAGKRLSREQIEEAFDSSFGEGAGQRVIVRCDEATGDITELWISLKGHIDERPDLAKLIDAAPPAANSNREESCASGLVVKVE